jgi:hypothetical protein
MKCMYDLLKWHNRFHRSFSTSLLSIGNEDPATINTDRNSVHICLCYCQCYGVFAGRSVGSLTPARLIR